MHQFRRIIAATAIPLAAVVGIALSAGVATSAPGGSAANRARATEPPPNNPEPVIPHLPSGVPPFTGQHPGPTVTHTKPPGTVVPSKTLKSITPSKTPSKSASPSTTSPKPSGTGGVVPMPGAGAGGCGRSATHPVTVKVGSVGGKQALQDGNGCALYLFTQDTSQASGCTGTCARQWPPLIAPSQAGQGVQQNNLGSFRRNNGAHQVTYFGHQLYYFSGDTQPGQANGQGVDQTFFLVDSKGNAIKP